MDKQEFEESLSIYTIKQDRLDDLYIFFYTTNYAFTLVYNSPSTFTYKTHHELLKKSIPTELYVGFMTEYGHSFFDEACPFCQRVHLEGHRCYGLEEKSEKELPQSKENKWFLARDHTFSSTYIQVIEKKASEWLKRQKPIFLDEEEIVFEMKNPDNTFE